MRAQLAQRRDRGTPARTAPRGLLRQHFDRAVHADGEHLVHLWQVRIGAVVLHIGAETADPGFDGCAIVGMGTDGAGQRQKLQGTIQIHAVGRPALGQAGARGLWVFRRRLCALDIGAEPARAQADRIAAVMAQKPPLARQPAFGFAGGNGPGVAAFGIAGAADERPARARGLQMQPPRATGRTDARIAAIGARRIKAGGHRLVDLFQHFGNAQIRRPLQRGREIAPEAGQHILVVALSGRDVVKLRLHLGGEIIAHVAREVIRQEDRHQTAFILWNQAVLVLADIAAVLDRGDDAGIGRGATNAQFFHPLDQRRLGEAGRRLGEMLIGLDRALGRGVACGQGGQALAILALVVIAALFIDAHEAVERDHLPAGTQRHMAIGAGDLGGGAFKARGFHLAGDGALPDQVVKAALVGIAQAQLFGIRAHIGGADAFMRFLGVLGLVLVHARGFGDVIGPEAALDFITRGHHRFGRHVDAVGAHIGDVACFIEALGGGHALLCAHAVFAAGFLLQGRGHEGCGRVARGRLCLDRLDDQRAGFDRGFGAQRGGFVGEREFLKLRAVPGDQPGLERGTRRRVELGGDGPVFLRAEGFDLDLAVDDQAQADRLHPPGRARAGQLAPKNRRQVEPHKIVQRAPRQIGAHQFHIDLTGGLHGLGHGGFGDRIEDHALHGRIGAQRAGFRQRLDQVPTDRLALAVGVGGEDQVIIGLERVGNRLEMLAAVGGNLPCHFEIIGRIDRAILGRQVADMAERGQNGEVRAQILVDGLCLCRRFDNDDSHVNL